MSRALSMGPSYTPTFLPPWNAGAEALLIFHRRRAPGVMSSVGLKKKHLGGFLCSCGCPPCLGGFLSTLPILSHVMFPDSALTRPCCRAVWTRSVDFLHPWYYTPATRPRCSNREIVVVRMKTLNRSRREACKPLPRCTTLPCRGQGGSGKELLLGLFRLQLCLRNM